MSTNCGPYSVEKVSNFVFCIRENEDLLLYLICGNEKAALIDTGTGNGNLYEFIQQNNLLKNKQKLIVLNTHNHAKQTGANWQFSAIGKVGKAHCVEDLCASGADKTYTRLLDSSFDWQFDQTADSDDGPHPRPDSTVPEQGGDEVQRVQERHKRTLFASFEKLPAVFVWYCCRNSAGNPTQD
uniref:Metallo-beta-lactamase domain-containing protein n=1 Tax=Panagrolaimus sp. JU765 TaxID=591449 RepID=A0AC34QCI7_9BILA